MSSIKNEKISKKNNILILGYGGASQAILYGLNLKGYKNINVFNRTKKRIKINGISKYTKKYDLINTYLSNTDLIINTTPTNPLGEKQIKLIKKNTLVSDIVYKPKHTVFLKKFEKNRKIYGIQMLIEQAIPCFKQWFGFSPEVDVGLLKKINNKIK
jgi:shikimate dehydrogenase